MPKAPKRCNVSNVVVYILHFDQPLHHARHYVGSTTADRVDARMHEHAEGWGSKITARAMRLGIKVYLAKVMFVSDRSYEKTLKRKGGIAALCRFCQQQDAAFNCDAPINERVGSGPLHKAPLLTWQQQIDVAKTAIEKGGRRE